MSEAYIWSFFKQKGLSDCGVAGLMGNLYAESGLKPTNLQNTYEKKLGLSDESYTSQVDSGAYSNFVHDSAGYGLAQWTFWSRKQNLLNFARQCGKSIGDLNMQLDFLWKELTEGYSSLVRTLQSAATIRAASDAVLVQFERPADQSESAKARRASYGQKYYDQYAGKGETMPSTNATSAVERLLATARAEISYIEKETNAQLDDKTANAGDNNWNKYARDLDALGVVYNGRKNGYAWCDIFTDWCFIHTFGLAMGMKLLCQAEKGLGAGCTYSANYYKQKGQFHTSNPQPGDQIFFTNDGGKTMYHTGIVEKSENGRVYTIEGNTSSLAGVVANGGCVRDKSYPANASYIGGYGRPDWSLVKDTASIPNQPEEDDDMDQAKFEEMFGTAMTNYLKSLQNNSSGDWSKEAREWAERVGLFAGNGTTIDGQPNMMWPSGLTREQAAVLFYRFAKECGLA